MKHSPKAVLVAAFLSVGVVGATPVHADEADNCAVAKSHAAIGQDVYGSVYDKAAKYLMAESITHTRYGYETRVFDSHSQPYPKTSSCLNIYGNCGADKFSIAVNLDDSEYREEPAVHFNIKEGAKDTDIGYILIGKLGGLGLVGHKSCGYGTMYISGHTWFAIVNRAEINGNIGDHAYVTTSLSQVGSTIASGYTPRGIQNYEDETLIIRLEDFGSSERYQHFMEITEPLQVSGTIAKYSN